MKPQGRYYSTAELMMLDEAARDQLVESGAVPSHRIMAAKFHLAARMPNKTSREYLKLKAKADAVTAEQQKAQAEVAALRQKVETVERELAQ